MTAAAFRSSWTKFAIAAINRAPRREQLRKVIGERNLVAIRRSSVVDWLPAEVHLSVVAAVIKVLGVEGARAFWKERLQASFDTKVMAPFVAGASVVYGSQPYALMKIAMSAFKLLAKDAGRITVSSGEEGVVRMAFADLAPGMADSAGWHALCHGQCQAVLAHLGLDAEITVGEPGEREFVYTIRRA